MTRRDLARLSSVRVGVPDPHATAGFLTSALRFHATDLEGGAVGISCDGEYGLEPAQASIALEPADSSGLRSVTFDVALDADLAAYAARLREAGVDVDEDDLELMTRDPDGVEVVLSQRRKPLGSSLPTDPLRPRRLGHTNLKVPDAQRSLRFYSGVLGLVLSESIGSSMFFLRAGTEHHNLGLRGGSERADVHHIAFEIAGWESYRLICDHLAALGHTVEYGPGRHGPGNNLFVYLRDPSSGLRLELYSDMAHIQDDAEYSPPAWEASDRPRTVNRWGPAPPASFLE